MYNFIGFWRSEYSKMAHVQLPYLGRFMVEKTCLPEFFCDGKHQPLNMEQGTNVPYRQCLHPRFLSASCQNNYDSQRKYLFFWHLCSLFWK